MARLKGAKLQNKFLGGLITEANALTFPENASYDEINMELIRDGSRRRRRNIAGDLSGALLRPDYATVGITFDDFINKELLMYKWVSVGGNPDFSLFVVQIAHKLVFFDASITPVVTGLRDEIVDLTNYEAGMTLGKPSSVKCEFAVGKGKLFVVNPYINPFYVRYNKRTDELEAVEIELRIRDFEGLDDGLDVDERPSTLSNEHKYNLRNQGWLSSAVVTLKSDAVQSTDPIISFDQYVFSEGLP